MATETDPHEESKPLRRRRLRISNACQACRLSKAKCDGGRPACARCQGRGKNCSYSRQESSQHGQQSKRKALLAPRNAPPTPSNHSLISASTSPSELPLSSFEAPLTPTTTAGTPPTIRSSSRSELSDKGRSPGRDQDPDQDSDQNRAYYTAHGRFAGQVAAAINDRAGFAPVAPSHRVPFVDAPLFGEIDLESAHSVLDSAAGLPPRAYADQLIAIYWQHVHPIEPVLDQKHFYRDYEAAYLGSGALLSADCDVWLSILNVVLGLAVQRQESIPLQRRDEEGNRFFRRAWALLRPETILWKPGTLELVQCLMLMNRYLHCTNNQQKTWMTAGLAVRIAQSMCFHLPEAPSARDSTEDRQIRHQVWASCVALDRCVSWSLGRTSAPSLIPLPNRPDAMSSSDSTRKLGLQEIGNQIQLAQTQTRNSLAGKLGLPRLYHHDEYHAVAVQLDACLNNFENDLPSDWKLQNIQQVVDRRARADRYIFHLRLLHSRIFLYRPMLARYYSLKTQTTTSSPIPTLSERLLRECAAMCVEAAQKVTSLIVETMEQEPLAPIGLLPWWNRIYYLHIAGTNFLAAMFSPDLFTESILRSWQSNMAALRAHEHLSAYVRQCACTFDALSAKILQTKCPPLPQGGGGGDVTMGTAVPLENASCPSSSFLCDDVFQEMDFDFDDFLFGAENFV